MRSEKLGHGDFSTSIPVGGTQEVGKLARTMEDMRNNLVELTGALRRREAEAQAVLSGIVEGVYAVDKSRVIRYLNPQAARLLGVQAHEAIGRFCGDVLKPCAGERPAALRDALPDPARAARRQCAGDRAAEPRQQRRAAHDDHHERGAGRRTAGAGHSRRDRAGRRAARARFGAREHLARIPHAARRTARVHRAAARGPRHDVARAAEGAGASRWSAARCA